PGDDVGLIAYLSGRSLAADDVDQIDRLVRQLGSRKFTERQRASSHLIAAGTTALPALKKHFEDADAEVARRAKECVEQIEKANQDVHAYLPLAAVRLLAKRNAEGTV